MKEAGAGERSNDEHGGQAGMFGKRIVRNKPKNVQRPVRIPKRRSLFLLRTKEISIRANKAHHCRQDNLQLCIRRPVTLELLVIAFSTAPLVSSEQTVRVTLAPPTRHTGTYRISGSGTAAFRPPRPDPYAAERSSLLSLKSSPCCCATFCGDPRPLPLSVSSLSKPPLPPSPAATDIGVVVFDDLSPESSVLFVPENLSPLLFSDRSPEECVAVRLAICVLESAMQASPLFS